jgi:hypothetical protein
MRTAIDLVQEKELAARADAAVALAISKDTRLSSGVIDTFCQRGFQRYEKAAVSVLESTDDHVPNMFSSALLALIERESLAGRIEGAIDVPLGTAGRIQLGAIVGAAVEEGASKPIGTLGFALAPNPRKVSATVITSTEFFRSFKPEDQAMIRRQLVAAAAAASDAVLVEALTTAAAHGTATPGALLAQLHAARKPVLIADFTTLVPLAATLLAIRELGVQVLASPAAAGKLIALDAAGLLRASDPIRVEIARDANVLLDDGGSPSGTEIVSLFQRNLLGIRAEQFVQLAVQPQSIAWATV